MESIRRVITDLEEMQGRIGADQLTPYEEMPLCWLAGMQTDETGFTDTQDPPRLPQSTWSATNCTLAVDRDDYVHGRQSLKMTVNSGATGTATCTLPFAIDVRGNIGVVVKVADLARIDYGYAYIDEDASNGYRFRWYKRATSNANTYFLINNEWACCWITRDIAVADGTPTAWNDATEGCVEAYSVARIRLQVVAKAGESPVVHFGGVVTQKAPKAGIIFRLDDGYQSQLTLAAPLLQQRGWRGNLGVNGFYVGSGNSTDYTLSVQPFLTVAEIDGLYHEYGWDVMSHGYTHRSFNSHPAVAGQEAELEVGRRYIEAHGWFRGSNWLFWPYGNGNNANYDAATVIKHYHDYASSMTKRGENETPEYYGVSRGFPWLRPCVFTTPVVVVSLDNDVTAAVAALDKIVKDRHVCVVLTHTLLPGGTGDAETICADSYDIFLDAVQTHVDAGSAEAITFSDLAARTRRRMPLLLKSRSAL